MQTMTLSDGVAYVERCVLKSVLNPCAGCAFDSSTHPVGHQSKERSLCSASVIESKKTFGGYCTERSVVYIKADPQPKE